MQQQDFPLDQVRHNTLQPPAALDAAAPAPPLSDEDKKALAGARAFMATQAAIKAAQAAMRKTNV
jgi:hypothetical protein